MHALAKAKIRECYKKNASGDPHFRSLTTSMKAHLRSTVGEIYWKKAHDYKDHIMKQQNERDQMQGQVQQQQEQQMVLSPSIHCEVNHPPAVVNSPPCQPYTGEIHAEDASIESLSTLSTEDVASSLDHSSCQLVNMIPHGPESSRCDAHPNLSPREGGNCRRRIQLWYRRAIQPFWKLKVAQVFCVIYVLVFMFSAPPVGIRDPATNDIIDVDSAENTANGLIRVNGSYRPVVAVGYWQKACLVVSRASAFSMYPMLVVVFVTKMKATHCYLSRTPISMYLGILNQAHEYHAHAGACIAFDVWIHALFHLLRWASQGNLNLLWTSAAGLSGLITVVTTPLIAFPMMYFKKRLSYEIRKG
jgi:hypothetical protein